MADDNNKTIGYIPGVCNIGNQEIKRRQKTGFIGIVLAILTIGTTLYLHSDNFTKSLIFIPLFIVALSFLQIRYRFCVLYGMKGVFMFNGAADKVTSPEFLRADHIKALKIIVYSLVIAAIGSIAFVLGTNAIG